MTRPACPSQPPEGRVTYEREVLSEAVLIRVSLNFDDAIMMSRTHERDALSEVVLIRVSYLFLHRTISTARLMALSMLSERALP